MEKFSSLVVVLLVGWTVSLAPHVLRPDAALIGVRAPVLGAACGALVFSVVLVHGHQKLRRASARPDSAGSVGETLQSLVAAAPFAFVAWNRSCGVLHWSEAAERIFGIAREDVLGRPPPTVLDPVIALQQEMREDGAPCSGVALDLFDARGGLVHAMVSLGSLPGAVAADPLLAAFVEDATPRRELEAKRMEVVRVQRDALVREIHHRIKNHLQGVAGLLRQHLAGRPLLQPLLEATTSQVLTIAAVHGLQGERQDTTLDLRSLLSRVAGSLGDILHAPIAIAASCALLDGVTVKEEEAVPVALVLNEILMNAVKHRSRTEGDGVVRVGAQSLPQGVRITVDNRGFLPERFSLELGTHLGTGLGLVKALLPTEGAALSITGRRNTVRAELELRWPEVLRQPENNPKSIGEAS